MRCLKDGNSRPSLRRVWARFAVGSHQWLPLSQPRPAFNAGTCSSWHKASTLPQVLPPILCIILLRGLSLCDRSAKLHSLFLEVLETPPFRDAEKLEQVYRCAFQSCATTMFLTFQECWLHIFCLGVSTCHCDGLHDVFTEPQGILELPGCLDCVQGCCRTQGSPPLVWLMQWLPARGADLDLWQQLRELLGGRCSIG